MIWYITDTQNVVSANVLANVEDKIIIKTPLQTLMLSKNAVFTKYKDACRVLGERMLLESSGMKTRAEHWLSLAN